MCNLIYLHSNFFKNQDHFQLLEELNMSRKEPPENHIFTLIHHVLLLHFLPEMNRGVWTAKETRDWQGILRGEQSKKKKSERKRPCCFYSCCIEKQALFIQVSILLTTQELLSTEWKFSCRTDIKMYHHFLSFHSKKRCKMCRS